MPVGATNLGGLLAALVGNANKRAFCVNFILGNMVAILRDRATLGGAMLIAMRRSGGVVAELGVEA